jgi:hypothetical protein
MKFAKMEYMKKRIRKNLTVGQQKLRNRILYEIWERYKGQYSMRELSRVLHIPLTTFFGAVKAEALERSKQQQQSQQVQQ